jgi:hypothetical protein
VRSFGNLNAAAAKVEETNYDSDAGPDYFNYLQNSPLARGVDTPCLPQYLFRGLIYTLLMNNAHCSYTKAASYCHFLVMRVECACTFANKTDDGSLSVLERQEHSVVDNLRALRCGRRTPNSARPLFGGSNDTSRSSSS